MISLLFVISAFLIGYSFNPSVEFKNGIEASSVALALFCVYVAHFLSKNRERVKEYENAYSLMNGICSVAEKIEGIVEKSKTEYKDGEQITASLPSVDIYSVCSEELLKIYQQDVNNLKANRFFDSDSVIAVLNFKLHFNLFLKYVLIYMDFNSRMDPNIRKCLNQFLQNRLIELKQGKIEEANKFLNCHNKILVDHFNQHCNSIVTQYKLLVKYKEQVNCGLINTKKKFLFFENYL